MGRGNYKYLDQADFRGGWCLEQENAAPNQLLTARNVWAPEGRLETRPGFVGRAFIGGEDAVEVSTTVETLREIISTGAIEDTGGNFDFGSATFTYADTRIYWGVDDPYYSGMVFRNFSEGGPRYTIDYSKGDGEWLPAQVRLRYSNDNSSPFIYVTDETNLERFYNEFYSSMILDYVIPLGWARESIIPDGGSALNKYWMRVTYISTGEDVDEYYYIQNPLSSRQTDGSSIPQTKAFYAPQFSSGKRYVFGGRWLTDYGTSTENDWGFDNSSRVDLGDATRNLALTKVSENEPASYANVPLFDECFIAYDYTVTKHKHSGTNELALAEDRDFAVGGDPTDEKTWAPYYPDWVAAFAEFPKCKYITFFAGKLWAANLEGADVQLQWSAGEPYHNVWPVTNVSNIMEDDNSPITGMSSLGENLVIFKNDSIWQMIYTQQAETGEDIFVPRKVTSTVGCVSNSSIVRTPLGLIFLAEDGVYLYNGNPTPTKISEPIDEFFTRVYAPRRRFAAATHYKTKNCYLLSLSVDASTENNLVLCYDYKHGAWYEWDNMPVEVWMPDEGPSDDERIYFGDSKSNLYELFGTHDDGQAIESTLLTHRKGFGDFSTKDLRELRINGSNDVNSWDVEVLKNDTPEGSGTSGALLFSDEVEAQWPVTAAGDYSHIIANGTALPTATGSISTAQHNMPGNRYIEVGLAENKAYTAGVLASGGVQVAAFTIIGVDEAGVARTELITLTEDAKFGVSVYQYYKVTSLALTTLTTVSSGTADAEYFVGYSAGPDKPKWAATRRREKRWTCRDQGEWFQVKLTANQFGRKMKLHRLSLGYITIGSR